MHCTNCGNELIEGDRFCRKCGNDTQKTTKQEPEKKVEKKKKNTALTIILIVVGVIVGFIILLVVSVFAIFKHITDNSSSMICKSDQGNITIMYNENELVGYTAVGFTYDFDGQKQIANDIGVEEYLKEFDTWFRENTNGSCTINEKKISNNTTTSNTKEIGSEEYGYINVPSDWLKFQDIDGNDSIQYSYANIFIVSMNILDDTSYTAKEYAENYMYNKDKSGEVEDVKGATLTIGDKDQYTAYQVYMYYPNDYTYLVTYWFEAEDGKTHYLAIEGPGEYGDTKLADLLYIPESFHLKK